MYLLALATFEAKMEEIILMKKGIKWNMEDNLERIMWMKGSSDFEYIHFHRLGSLRWVDGQNIKYWFIDRIIIQIYYYIIGEINFIN